MQADKGRFSGRCVQLLLQEAESFIAQMPMRLAGNTGIQANKNKVRKENTEARSDGIILGANKNVKVWAGDIIGRTNLSHGLETNVGSGDIVDSSRIYYYHGLQLCVGRVNDSHEHEDWQCGLSSDKMGRSPAEHTLSLDSDALKMRSAEQYKGTTDRIDDEIKVGVLQFRSNVDW